MDSEKIQAETAYGKVLLARRKGRPLAGDYISALFDGFMELHGDRLYRDDPAIIGGIAMFHGLSVTVIGQRKGKTTPDQIRYNFGMTSPEGFRKARRLMQQAEKFHRPVITLIDTPGAYPGVEAESNGQSNAIAECLAYMSAMRTPSIAIIIGEGNSGGALALAVSDRVWMLENAVYSILSPEGFASILWKDAKRAPEASELMKITAADLMEYELIDAVISEREDSFEIIDQMLKKELKELMRLSPEQLVSRRYRKIRSLDKAVGITYRKGAADERNTDRGMQPGASGQESQQ